ncbi:MAG TPA: PEP-CTERM sorting domain-containing protein [Burkholderiaceae bacterium]
MKRLFARSPLVVMLAAPLLAHAVDITAGTSEYITFRDCIAGVTACDSISPIVSGQYGGNPGAYSSAATSNHAGYGSASGSVSFSGVIGAPVLHASASADPGKRANTNSVALQSWTYTGSTPTTRTFGGTLTYNQALTGTYPDTGATGVYATIDAFTLTAASIDAGIDAASNFNALFGEPWTADPSTGYVDLAQNTFSDDTSQAGATGNLGVTVSLTPGETVWLYVLLQTPAVNGSVVDASHTLVTGWSDATDLVPAVTSAPVPEPSSWALIGCGLAAVAVLRRRHDRTRRTRSRLLSA